MAKKKKRKYENNKSRRAFIQSVDSVREIASESDSKYEKIENEFLREIA